MSYSVVHELDQQQIDDLLSLFSNEFWCNHRTRAGVVRMLQNTDLVFGLVDETGRLIGFTRVLTDFVYRATLYDVIVAPSHRGKGLGRVVLDAVMSHPQLRDVESIDLNCKPAMRPFYERWGFTGDLGETIRMRRKKPIGWAEKQ